MENPKDRHWSRASHAAKNGAKRKINAANNWTAFRNFYLLIITFLIYIFSWFLLQNFFLIYAQEKINGPTLYNSLEFWW